MLQTDIETWLKLLCLLSTLLFFQNRWKLDCRLIKALLYKGHHTNNNVSWIVEVKFYSGVESTCANLFNHSCANIQVWISFLQVQHLKIAFWFMSWRPIIPYAELKLSYRYLIYSFIDHFVLNNDLSLVMIYVCFFN